MSLGGGTVTNWDRMKQVFLEKYQEYCNTKDKRIIVQNGAEGRQESGRFCRKAFIQCAKSWIDEHGVRCAQDNPTSRD